MITTFYIFLSSSTIIASLVALYILIIGSFENKETKKVKIEPKFIKRESRTIKTHKADENQLQKDEGLDTQTNSLLWTVIIGQVVGLYFLFIFLSEIKIFYIILKINAVVLLLASFLCSILTMLNGWLKKKMEVLFRLIFQGYSLGVAMILFRIGWGITLKEAIRRAGVIPDLIVYVYFLTVIIALTLMLFDGSAYQKRVSIDFNFNIYFLIVVLVGMFVGLGLKIALSIL